MACQEREFNSVNTTDGCGLLALAVFGLSPIENLQLLP